MICASAMTPVEAILRPETPIAEAVGKLVANQLQPMPVVDAECRLLGVFGQRDLARIMLPAVVRLGEDGCDLGFVSESSGVLRERLAEAEGPVSAFMTPTHGVPADTSLVKALARLYQGDECLPVVGEDGRLQGIVTMAAALAALLEQK